MSNSLDQLFDTIKSHLERLSAGHDSEAMRHDLIIHPLLTSPLALGWDPPEIVSQKSVKVPSEIISSYVWKGAVPKQKRPDICIMPYGLSYPVTVIEEKARQISLQKLREHLGQLKEYQYLHNTVWGLLTDGEKWILQKNNETFHQYASLDELRRGMSDLRECIGREALMDRLYRDKTTDLVIVRPNNNIIVIISPSGALKQKNIVEYLWEPTPSGRDLIKNLQKPIVDALRQNMKPINKDDIKKIVFNNKLKVKDRLYKLEKRRRKHVDSYNYLIADSFFDICSSLTGGIELLLNTEMKLNKEEWRSICDIYGQSLQRFANWYPVLDKNVPHIKTNRMLKEIDFKELCSLINDEALSMKTEAIRLKTNMMTVVDFNKFWSDFHGETIREEEFERIFKELYNLE
ncbi:MAG: hypothetical protein FD174_624 [Geobacteraceae bacterium]|nr:MAG: hypothetical protein FD174_624 [Geobacteraceae bacterium]